MSSCSNCIAENSDWLTLKSDLIRIDGLNELELKSLIETLLSSNEALEKSISSVIDKLVMQGYLIYVTILSEELRDIPQNITKQRDFAKKVRILNFKLQILSGNITNLILQLKCSPD
jgi:hypothetical protein